MNKSSCIWVMSSPIKKGGAEGGHNDSPPRCCVLGSILTSTVCLCFAMSVSVQHEVIQVSIFSGICPGILSQCGCQLRVTLDKTLIGRSLHTVAALT